MQQGNSHSFSTGCYGSVGRLLVACLAISVSMFFVFFHDPGLPV
jgi:hypothetical protein